MKMIHINTVLQCQTEYKGPTLIQLWVELISLLIYKRFIRLFNVVKPYAPQ